MKRIQNVRTHMILDLENIELSVENLTSPNGFQFQLRKLNDLMNHFIAKKGIGEHQIHVCMPMLVNASWCPRKRDKLQQDFKYHVVTAQKTFNGEYSKADMDAVMGTLLGLVSAQPKTEEIWLFTGDGDFIPTIRLLGEEMPHIRIKIGCLPSTAKGDLLKKAKETFFIHPDTPGVELIPKYKYKRA